MLKYCLNISQYVVKIYNHTAEAKSRRGRGAGKKGNARLDIKVTHATLAGLRFRTAVWCNF